MKIASFCTFLVCASLTYAQEDNRYILLPSQQIGELTDSKGVNKKIVGEINGNIYALGQNGPIGIRSSLYKYNDQLQLVGETKIFNNEPKKQFHGVLKINNSLLKATSSQLTKTSEGQQVSFELQYINPEDLNSVAPPITLEKITYLKEKNRPSFFWSISPDSSKIAVFSFAKTASPYSLKSTIRVLNSDLKTLWAKEYTINNVSTTFSDNSHASFQLENSGNILLLFGSPEKPNNEPSNAYKVISIQNLGDTFKEYDIPKPNGFSLLIPFIKSDGNTRLHLAGEYFSKGKHTVGTYFQQINLENGVIEEPKLSPNNPHVKFSHEDEGLHPEDFVLKDVIPANDGGFVYIFEYSNIRINYNVRKTVVYGDLLAKKVDNKGNELWATLIPKFQHHVGLDDYLSYTCIKVNNNIYLVFNQNKGTRNSYYNSIVQITENGLAQKSELFGNEYFPILPSSAFLFNNRLIFFASSEIDHSKSRLMQLNFNKTEKRMQLIEEPNSTMSTYTHHQDQYKEIRKATNTEVIDSYLGVSLSLGINNAKNTNGTASVNFPYISSYGAGGTRHIAALSNSYSSNLLGTIGLGLELQRHLCYGAIGGELPFLGSAWTSNDFFYANFYAGIGIRLVLPNNNFAFRIGGDLLFNYITNPLGRIDNQNKTLNIDGNNSYSPTFIVHSRYGSAIYNVDYSQVGIAQSSWGFAPKLGFEYLDKNGRTIYRLNAGYNFSFYNYNQITITQFSSNGYQSNNIEPTYDLTNTYFKYHFNENTQNAPASVNNLFSNVQIIFLIPEYSSSNQRK